MRKLFKNLLRIFNRNQGFLFINITGLAIGLAVSLMLLLFVATELSYDRHFENKERIVSLRTVGTEEGRRSIDPICLRSAYTELPSKIPGIESAVQIYRGFDVELIKDQQRFQNIGLLYADPEFFDVFSMDFLHGNPSLSLKEPNTAVITDKTARNVFGNLDVIGKTFFIHGELFTVTGVVEELPVNTHFSFDVLASMRSVKYVDQLDGLEFFTYYILRPDISKSAVCEAINKLYIAMLQGRFKEFNIIFESATENLTDIYLYSKAEYNLGARGSIESVFILTGLAMVILLLAITNFVNLFVVQGDKRALEVGIRKTIGGRNKDIATQFFFEATAIVLVAFFIGAFLATAFIDRFALLINKTVEPSLIYSPLFISGIVLLIIVTILLSASYPAFYLSRFRPVDVLKRARKSSKRKFTISIAIFQSVITIVLITVILVVNKQLKYMQRIPKGYNTDNVMVIMGVNEKIALHYDDIKQNLEKLSEIQMVSAAQHVVGGGTSGQGIYLLGANDKSTKSISEYRVMPGLIELMKLELVEGSSFGENVFLNKNSVVISEGAARMLGIAGSAVGKKVVMFEDPMEVIGVVRDFYYEAPAKPVKPIALTSYQSYPSYIYVRFDPLLQKSLAAQMILPIIRQYDPDFVLNPRWCEDIYTNKFYRERSLTEIVTTSTVLSLIIALLGLFAIHSYSAIRRTKEIGIRKVLGSKPWSIMYLLSNEVVKLILIAGLISIPVSFFIVRSWLENYANRTPLGWILFILPVLLQLAFAVLTTMIVSARVSLRNPVESLRYE